MLPDDYIDENMYERLLDYALQENVDIVHTGYWYETGNQSYAKINYDAQVLCSENSHNAHQSFLKMGIIKAPTISD